MLRRLSLVLLAVGCSGATIGPEPPWPIPRIGTARPPQGDRPLLRVVTYNVNFGIAGDADTLAALEAVGGDVVLLQETNRTWEAALIRALGDRYPFREFEHRPAAGGAAVLSKYPIDELEILEPTAEGAWFPAMRVVVQTPAGAVQLLNVHLRPQLSDSGSVVSGYFATPPIREAEIAGFQAKLDPALRTVIAGDFNESTSGSATDRLTDAGFVDALHEFAPSAPTWRWPTSFGNLERSFDRILYRPGDGLEPIEAEVIERGRSDHLPVVTVFELAR